jgi:hypothetical protein
VVDRTDTPGHAIDGQADLIVTAKDRENARVRREIADRQEAVYSECLAWAQTAFGNGWRPSHRHFLLDRDEEDRVRHTRERPQPAATVYAVKNPAGEIRHFTIENGVVVAHESYQTAFGPMLLEPHPTRGFQHQGRFCPIHRYSLCFAPYERYEPKTAEELAALRASRERRKAARERLRWEEQHPLWARLPEV